MQPPIEIESDWERYKGLRSSGLKKQANKALLTVIQTMEKKGLEYFKVFLYSLCEEGLGGHYESKVQHPMFVRCLLPLLVSGVKSKSAKEIIYVVKARSSGFGKELYESIGDIPDRDLLKIVLSTEPNNQTALNLLAADYIEELYFGAHHLPEVLITDLSVAKSVSEELAKLILSNKSLINESLVTKYSYYTRLYEDYEIWLNGQHTYDFAKWCERNKRTYSWVASYKYN